MGSDGSMPDTPMMQIDAPPDSTLTVGCPGGYNLVTGAGTNLYRVVTANSDWPDAQAFCRATTLSANLFVPDTLAELQAINAINGIPASYWVGLQDPNEGTYVTVLNQAPALSPLPWGGGEPDDGPPSEDCVNAVSSNNTIRTERCNQTMPSVCECVPN